MASLHFIVQATAATCPDVQEEPKRVALQVEVEGSAPIKSQTELLRAARSIAAEQIERALGTQTLGELTVVPTKRFDKEGQPLTSADWPGTLVWRVSTPDSIAA